MKKEVLNQPVSNTQYLFVLSQLEAGLRPSQICKKFNIHKNTLQNYLSTLKAKGLIKKIGYGVWEIIEKDAQKEVLKSTRVATINPQLPSTSFKPDSVRGHAFQFTFSLPNNFRNWDKRKQILQQLGIIYKELHVFGGGEQFEFKGRKVWLTNKSIIIFEKASYLAETSHEAKSFAISNALEIVRALERHLKMNMGTYRFKVSRQHYSLIKNALARQYDQEGKKLEVYNDSGLWFLIDNSFNLNEAETVHPKTADTDNKKVQDFFNGLKVMEGFTPQFVVNTLATQAQNIGQYAIHLKSHVESVQKLGTGVQALVSTVEELTKVVKELKQ